MAEGAAAALARFTDRKEPNCPPIGVADVADLVPEARIVAGMVWQRRHANEQASVTLAKRMQASAETLLQGDDVIDALSRFRADEQRHVDIAACVLHALGAELAAPQSIQAPPAGEPTALSFARDVVVGLVVCEAVSAARFAVVRAATDLPLFRHIISVFLRDEVAHGALGLLLLPEAVSLVRDALGREQADRWILDSLMKALLELELTVGLDGARQGLRPPRPQPRNNPGVIEPDLDAHAFYRAVTMHLLPRLEARGLAVKTRWDTRFD